MCIQLQYNANYFYLLRGLLSTDFDVRGGPDDAGLGGGRHCTRGDTDDRRGGPNKAVPSADKVQYVKMAVHMNEGTYLIFLVYHLW